MLNTTRIHPLTDFLRNHKQFIAELKESKTPEVLTVNGKAELVLMDAETYQAIAEQVEELLRIAAIKEGLAAAERGEMKDASQVLSEIQEKYGLPR